MRTFLLLAALLASGCATAQVQRAPGADQGTDSRVCEKRAAAEFPELPPNGTQCYPIGSTMTCVAVRVGGGWQEGFDEAQRVSQKREFKLACMAAKGW